VNAVDTNDVFALEEELRAVINSTIEEKGLDLFLFVATNILTNDSVALALGKETAAVEKAFNVVLADEKAVLQGVVSRKKQIVPNLTDALTK
jgi:manganese-dependent inorganic pyrophosphatase